MKTVPARPPGQQAFTARRPRQHDVPVRRPRPEQPRIILFNKPYGVICQFSPEEGKPTLKDFVPVADVYPAGRLDTDSEGLVVLVNDGRLQHAIAGGDDSKHTRRPSKMRKLYQVQVEGSPVAATLTALQQPLHLGDFITRPCVARVIEEPAGLWPRNPPIRYRREIPTAWIEIELEEGKNRQVRRMTAKVGHPTLRLLRWRVGPWSVDSLQPGQWRELPLDEAQEILLAFLPQGASLTEPLSAPRSAEEKRPRRSTAIPQGKALPLGKARAQGKPQPGGRGKPQATPLASRNKKPPRGAAPPGGRTALPRRKPAK